MTMIDLSFTISANQPIPVDHGYRLFAAISSLVPQIHGIRDGLGIHPIRGQQIGNRQLQLVAPLSRLTLRLDTDHIASILPLAGMRLDLGTTSITVGIPEVRALVLAPALRSRLVTTKNCTDQARFETELRRQLDALSISSQAQFIIPINHAGKPRRRTLRIRDKEIVGYETIVECLTAEESLALQTHGLGGRRHMGCGVFVPFDAREGGSDG